MDTYLAKLQIGNNSDDLAPIASTLFGVCNSLPGAVTKVVTLNKFDNLVHGVTVYVKFTHGCYTATGLRLQVGSTLAQDILGDCTCGENEIIAFTFEEVDAYHKYWHPNTSGISAAMRDYVSNLINTSTDTPDVVILKGTVGAGGNPGYLPASDYETGWAYRVIAAGTYAGNKCNVDDLLIAVANAVNGQSAINNNHWVVIQGKVQDIVQGPASAVDQHVAIFDDNTGKLIADSGYTIGTSVPEHAVFTDTTYSVDSDGLNLNANNEISIVYGTTQGTVARGNHNHDTSYATLNHTHGVINNDGSITNGGNALLRTNDGDITLGPTLGNDATKFLNNTGAWTLPPVTSVNNQTGDVTINAASIGVGEAVHFIGKVASNSPYTPSDETNGTPTINGWEDRYQSPYTPVAGDIVIDKDDSREYIYTISNVWELLGQDSAASTTLDSNDTTPSTPTSINTWISRIQQRSDLTISVERATLDTTGHWLGDAALLGTSSIGSATRPIYLVDGAATLGSTYAGGSKVILNDTDLGADSATFYAPTTSGRRYSILVSDTHTENNNFITEPQWAPAATLESILSTSNATAYTTLTLGNNIATGTSNNSEGKIVLYSANTAAHIIQGSSTTNEYTHTLPNRNGYIVQIASMTAVGKSSIIDTPSNNDYSIQSIYVNSNGILTGVNYRTNRIYYGEVTTTNSIISTSYTPSSHYINDTQIAINYNSDTSFDEALYVVGATTITGNTKITSVSPSTGTGTGALQVGGGASIDGKLYVYDEVTLNDDLSVAGNTTLNGYVGIGQAPESGNNAHRLTVNGTVHLKNQVDITGRLCITNQTAATNNDGSLITEGGIRAAKNLYIDTTATIWGNTAIGMEANANSGYILSTKGSIELTGTHTSVATFNISSISADNTTIDILTFIPSNDGYGYIGTSNSKWHSAAFADSLTVGSNNITLDASGFISIANDTSSILMSTEISNSVATGVLTITTTAPTIVLDTLTANAATWNLNNTAGTFTLANNNNTPTSLIGNDTGIEISPRLYMDGNIIPSLTNNTADKTLGSADNHWAKLYIGDDSQHGDPYLPIYWHNGEPDTVSPVQYVDFTISSGKLGVLLTHAAFTEYSYVLQIVVTNGEEYLTSAISWENYMVNNTSDTIKLSCSATSGAVSGYIVVARGTSLSDVTSTQIEQSQSQSEPEEP